MPLTAVLDTNVIVKALISETSWAAQIFDAFMNGRFTLATSESILAEIRRTLHKPKVQAFIMLSPEEIEELLLLMRGLAVLTTDLYDIRAVAADPDDDKFLACAVEANAQYLVSDDKQDLLALKEYRLFNERVVRNLHTYIRMLRTEPMQQTREDLEQHLQEQVEFLHSSARAFDEGFEGEAKRMAVVVRVLVHDTAHSKSLLSQLGLLGLAFYDTAKDWDPRNLLSHHGLVGLQLGITDASYRAPLDDRPPHLLKWATFQKWWNKIVFADHNSNQLTRKDVVLSVANQDGGAHIDPSLNDAYAALSRQKSISWIFSDGRSERPMSGKIELVSIRQIAHEVLTTLSQRQNIQ
jgi:putative PIN family toxin of toxin-antitoxin system